MVIISVGKVSSLLRSGRECTVAALGMKSITSDSVTACSSESLRARVLPMLLSTHTKSEYTLVQTRRQRAMKA